jgi:hypothetical protein
LKPYQDQDQKIIDLDIKNEDNSENEDIVLNKKTVQQFSSKGNLSIQACISKEND